MLVKVGIWSLILFCEPIFRLMGRRYKLASAKLPDYKRILIVKLDSIGDMVLAVPFLRELRINAPSARVTLLASPNIRPLLKTCPYVDEVLTYPKKCKFGWRAIRDHVYMLIFIITKLLPKRFDLAILPRWDVDLYRGSFFTYLSGAGRRVGYSESACHAKQLQNRYCDKFFTDIIVDKDLRHEVWYNLNIIELLGGRIFNDKLNLWHDKNSEDFAKTLLQAHKGKGESYDFIGIGPGANALARRWPIERFLKLIEEILEDNNFIVVLLGSKPERGLGQHIDKRISRELSRRVINMIGKTNLGQAAALIKCCSLYIGNDSGLAHIAAGVDTSVVIISSWSASGDKLSKNSPFRFRPWSEKAIIINPSKPLDPCSKECLAISQAHCIKQVSVDQVRDAVEKMLKVASHGVKNKDAQPCDVRQ